MSIKTKNENKKSFGAGKGDKRRPYDYETFTTNYEKIDWKNGLYCCNCGKFFSNSMLVDQKDSYVSYDDGSIECKSCNFN